MLGSQVVEIDFNGIPFIGNTNNGSIIGLTQEGSCLYCGIRSGELSVEQFADADSQLYSHMQTHGYFDNSPAPEEPNAVYFHLTQNCTLRCTGCYSDATTRNRSKDASYGQITSALKKLSDAGVSSVFFSGGEPFLRDDLSEIIIYAHEECNFDSIVLLTNGTCIDEDSLARMEGYVSKVSVSFDGTSNDSIAYIRLEQRYDQLVQAIKTIQSQGINSHIIFTIHAKNINDMEECALLAESLDATFHFSLLSHTEDSPAITQLIPKNGDFALLSKNLIELNTKASVSDLPIGTNLTSKRSCGAGCTMLSVGSDGTVYPCHMLQRPEYEMGNLFSDSLESCLTSSVGRFFSRLQVDGIEVCGSCNYRYICGGGCRARALFASGTINTVDPYCDLVKNYYDDLSKAICSTQRGGE